MKTPGRRTSRFLQEPSQEIDDLAHSVIGAAIEVHRFLGPGYLESIYEEALVHELGLQNILFERQVVISVEYKGFPVGQSRLDLLVAEILPVELKAVETFSPDSPGSIALLLENDWFSTWFVDQFQCAAAQKRN